MTQARSESLTVRPPRLADAQDIADLHNACAVERTGKPSTGVQAVRNIMQMPGVDLETDCLLAFGPSGQIEIFEKELRPGE